MKKILLTALMCNLVMVANAQTLGENQATAFTKIYQTTCMKYLNDLDILRSKLGKLPHLPTEKAQLFLNGNEGKAYPVPDKSGLFVLTLPNDKNMCSVHARRADTKAVKKAFMEFFSQAPEKIIVKKIATKTQQTQSNGKTERLSYQWYVKGAKVKMMFMLTITPDKDAQLQALFTAARVND